MSRGQSLELFFIDGTPDGMLTAEIFNWTGHVLLAPRTRLPEALKREEASYTGVYILIGDSDSSELPRVYIGESDDVASRLKSHDAQRDWWTQAVLITSTANSLNKAHVRYLESRLIEEAIKSGRMVLENGTRPPLPALSESAKSNMEQFIEHVLTVLPAIRIDGFLVKTRVLPIPVRSEMSTEHDVLQIQASPEFAYRLSNGEVDAVARLLNGEFVVEVGSRGRRNWIGVRHNYQRLFDEVVETNVYLPDGEGRRFAKAYAFSSPSAAAAVLSGRSAAGPICWVLKNDPKITYKQWEEVQLAE